MGVWELSVPSLKLVCNSKIILKYKVKKKKKKAGPAELEPSCGTGPLALPRRG